MVLNKGEIISDRYEILGKIGSGGMSIVYKALDTKLGREVTFKVLREEYLEDEEFLERFKSEGEAVAKLSHQNIVNIYDVGIDGEINYLVMEYIDGLTLKDLIVRRAPFGDVEVLGVATQIAEALAHAHRNSIIHRDIKPQNILVTKDGVIKVTDFGIARMVNAQTIPDAKNTMGSVHYFSPEQAKGAEVDEKSDLYSLGVLMFEMVTGKLPFDGDTVVSIVLKQINDPLPPIGDYNPEISSEVAYVIEKLTQKKPFNRYKDALELGTVLKELLVTREKDLPVGVRHNSIVLSGQEFDEIKSQAERIRRREDRKKPEDKNKLKELMIVGSAILLALILIGGAGFYVWNRFFRLPNVDYKVMPNLVGQTYESAEAVMRELGLEIYRAEDVFDEMMPADTITYQSERFDTKLPEGSRVGVRVSLGRAVKSYPVPNFVGQEVSRAYEIAGSGEVKFLIEDIPEFNKAYPISIVFKQEPAAGDQAEAGSTIKLYVSRGEEAKNTLVPSLVGLSEADAKLKLLAANLEIGSIKTVPSSRYAKGLVAEQDSPSGTSVLEKTIIGFSISSGPPPATTAPAASASPGASPAPPSSTPGEQKSKVLSLNPIFPDDVSEIEIKLLKQAEAGYIPVYEAVITRADLPVEAKVSGSGSVTFVLLVNGAARGELVVNFDE